MHGPHLPDLCDRLSARLEDSALTRYQLLDIATVLTFMERDLHRGFSAQGGAAIDDLHASLVWVRNHGNDAAVSELRVRVAAAMNAVTFTLGCDASSPSSHSGNSFPSHQERARA